MSVPDLSAVAGQPGWLNDGVSAVVRDIEKKTAQKSGKPFWVVQLASATGPDTAELAVFGKPPTFGSGDVLEITGKGVKLEDGQYGLKVSTGKDSVVNVVGRSAHHAEQEQRKAAGQPAVDGRPNHVNGQTVGMAVKASFDLALQGVHKPGTFAFWAEVKQTASNIIRISRSLEGGHLSPPPADWPQKAGAATPAPATRTEDNRAGDQERMSGGRQDPPKPAQRPQPGPGGSVLTPLEDEDVPF